MGLKCCQSLGSMPLFQKKNQNEPIPNMASRLLESVQVMSKTSFLEREVKLSIRLVHKAHAGQRV